MNFDPCRRKHILVASAFVGALLCGAPVRAAEDYPTRPVKVIVPYNPGANPDLAARIVGEALAKRLGQPFVMEQRTGAGGSIGTSAAAKATPDGYTLVVGHVAGLAINPSVYTSLPYDVAKDFAPISLMYKSPLLLVVAENSPYKTIGDIVAAAKAKPGEITFSSGGNGTGAHLSGEALSSLSGASTRHIPYKSVSASLVGVVSGDVTFAFANQSLIWPLVEGKKLRPIAFSGDVRVADHPEVPLASETLKGFVFYDWAGLLAPARTPPEILAKLQREVTAALARPEVIEQMRNQGLYPAPTTTAEFRNFIDSEQKKWGAVAKSINLKLD